MLKKKYLENCAHDEYFNQYGLKHVPMLVNVDDHFNDLDYIHELIEWEINVGESNGNGQFSFKNAKIMKNVLKELGDECKCVVEIGVARNYKDSSTDILINNKPDNCFYIGIDINCGGKTEYMNHKPNVRIVGIDSKNHEYVRGFLDGMKIEKIDLLFIDGNHSINMMINDWKYSKHVIKNGYVLIHDTNNHPGPHFIYDNIDENRFEKKKYFTYRKNDCGIAVCRKLVD